MIPADKIKTIVAHPNTGLVYVSEFEWVSATDAIRAGRLAEFHLADSSAAPAQWAEALKAFPEDAEHIRAGEWAKKKNDIEVEAHSSLYLFRPSTEAAKTWLEEHTDGQWFGGALAVEPRYAHDLASGAASEGGFTVGGRL